jgi:hypothetical protein
MQKQISIIVAILFFLASCSNNNKKEVQIEQNQPIPQKEEVKKPLVEYELISLDTNKRFQIEYFLITPYENYKSKLRKGKSFDESLIGEFNDSEWPHYVTGPGRPPYWVNEKGQEVPEPREDYTNCEVVMTDTLNGIVIQSNYKVYGTYYSMASESTSEHFMTEDYLHGNGRDKIADEVRDKWKLQISDGKEKLPIRFTSEGIEVPKQFVEKFKKAFLL